MQITPYIIGIAGRSCSGKSTLARKLKEAWKEESIIIEFDKFIWYSAELNLSNPSEEESLLLKEICQEINNIKNGKPAKFPIFDCHNKRKSKESLAIYNPAKFVIVDGTFLLWDKSIRDLFDLKIFMDTPNETGLKRRKDRHIKYLLSKNISYEPRLIEEKISNRWQIISGQWDKHLADVCKKHTDIIIHYPDSGFDKVFSYIENLQLK